VDEYRPNSAFLMSVAAGDVCLSRNMFAEENLLLLLELMRDDDASNRDWVTFLLAQTDLDTDAVRCALLASARDEETDVRAEAIHGLAMRDRSLALPLVKNALREETISMPVLESATLCSDKSLIEDLRVWSAIISERWLRGYLDEAIAACERGSVLEFGWHRWASDLVCQTKKWTSAA